nr:hypothetical protein [uncultured Oscillibacter sp.]
MEFGYTIPLQRHLKMRLPSSAKATAPFFCWDAHLLTVQKRKAALAINHSSRYCILLYGLNAVDWKRLPELMQGEIRAAILREGLSEFEVARYFALGGPLKISRSHGPESTAALNWAMRAMLPYVSLLDNSRLSQLQIAHIMNGEVYHTAEPSVRGSPREFFLMGFRHL